MVEIKNKDVRSIRKALVNGVIHATNLAHELTGQSINALPEYFLSLKVAEHINNHFSSFTFSLENSLYDVCENAGINPDGISPEFRIEKRTRADLTLKNKTSNKVTHIIEFKRHIQKQKIKKDIVRLAWLCQNAPYGHKLERNYLVAISQADNSLFIQRTNEIKDWVNDISPCIDVLFEPIDLAPHMSTRKNGIGKKIHGGVWELKFKY